ncbi:MAG: family 1 glycosylhydrolase [Proteobacteria bacterium]|nr:family 1 glycosylhydrolase [Pseudomonadota bacterium]
MSVDRRSVLSLALAAAASTARAKPLPPSFLWGAATAGHQVEGSNINSDMWLLEQVSPTVFAEPSGDACDSFHRWREDIAIVKALGLNTYRFSIEWSRIEPAKGQFSQASLDHYVRMADYCLELGLSAVVTFNHFTTPRWFAAQGGWENAEAPALFSRFCDFAASALAERIAYALTFNEPNLALGGRWSIAPPPEAFQTKMTACLAAAAKASGSDQFSLLMGDKDPRPMIPNVIEAHRLAREAIKSHRAMLRVGLSLAVPDEAPVTSNSAIERKRADVYGAFFAAAKDDDFIGVQVYGRDYIGPERSVPAPKDVPRRANGMEWFPAAVGNVVRYVHGATGKPILVTENGIDTSDDAERARFIPAAVKSVLDARDAGVPVLGYIHWSLLDNFEWLSGYGPKYGLVAVDRQTFKRTVKPSAELLGRIARAGGVA